MEMQGEQQEQLVACRDTLLISMQQAEQISSGLHRLSIHLDHLGSRIPTLRSQIGPLEGKLEASERSRLLTDGAMRAADQLLDRFEALRRLQLDIETGDPEQDIGAYLLAVLQLEESLSFLLRHSPAALRRLHQALESHRYLQPHASSCEGEGDSDENGNLGERLRKIPCSCGDSGENLCERLREMVCSCEDLDDNENLGERLRRIAVGKLRIELQRLLLKSPNIFPRSKKKKKKKIPPLPLEIPVVQKLRMIIRRMSSIGALQLCIDLYQRSRVETLLKDCPSMAAIPVKKLEQHSTWSGCFRDLIQMVFLSELNLCRKVFSDALQDQDPQAADDQVSEIFAAVAEPGMLWLLEFGENAAALLPEVAILPEKLFNLLEMFDAMQTSAEEYTMLFHGQGKRCSRIRVRVRELHKLLVDSACKILSGVKSQIANPIADLPRDAGVHPVTRFTMDFTICLLSDSHSRFMEQVLRIQEAWGINKPSTKIKPGLRLVDQAVVEIIERVQQELESQSVKYKEGIHRHLFLMNNAYFMLKRVDEKLGARWIKEQRRRIQQLGLEYQKRWWGNAAAQIMSRQQAEVLLLSPVAASADTARETVRVRLGCFRGAVEEICERHRGCVVADEELRNATRSALVHTLVPAYRSYLQFYAPLLVGKNDTPSDFVDAALAKLFQSLTPTSLH